MATAGGLGGAPRGSTRWLAAVVLIAGALAMLQLVWTALDDRYEWPYPRPNGPVVVPPPANTLFAGETTFRGNDTRSYYGEGPVPAAPAIRWRAPVDGLKMCSFSAEGLDPSDTKEWCGTGWTGQPNTISFVNGMVEIREGAYDDNYHFLDGMTGAPVRPELVTGDLAKGSATTDPDGYPLYYAGSRDNLFRVIAMDRPEPKVLWTIDANTSVPDPMWNDDWDGAALIVDDYLLEGGENGYLYVVRLNRGYRGGLVTVHPETVATIQGWDDELLADIGDEDVSIESSVSFLGGVVYFANSGGLVQGWDISDLLAGGTGFHQVFRYWTGDDTDASVVIDDQGYLYVASEWQRFNDRGKHLGQLLKLDPRADDPFVWALPAMEIGFEGAGGSWSTPALYGDYVYFTTAAGRLLEVDRATGHIVWELQIGSPAIGSPVVVDNTLLQGDCTGHLYAWDVSDPTVIPPMRWNMDLGDCIESTPAVWRGWIYLGTREGYLYGLADPPSA
jgi:PQQ-like domain